MNNSTNSTIYPWHFSTNLPFMMSIYSINVLLGFPLNVYIMILHRKLHLSDFFILNQAAIEIFFMLLSPLHCICTISMELCFFKPVGFFHGCRLIVRPLFQCMVCLERYVAVVHPVTFLKFRNLRYRIVPSIMAWMTGMAFGSVCMMTFPNLPYKFLFVMYLIILMVTTFSCLSVLKKLKHPGPGNKNKKREDGAKTRAFQVITVNLFAFVIQTIPLTIMFWIKDKLSMVAYETGLYISLGLNLLMGWVQAVFMLYRAGNLPFRGCT